MTDFGRARRAASSIVITRRGIGFIAAAIASFLSAAIFSLPALLYVTGLLLAVVALAVLYVLFGHSRVVIERSFAPQIVSPGTLSRTRVRLTNHSPLPCLEAEWEDHLPHGITGDAAGTLPALGGSHTAHSRISFTYDVQGLRRGQHSIGPLHVRVHDPFGLAYRRHTFGETGSLTVLPRQVDLNGGMPWRSADDGALQPAPRQVGIGDDDIIARSYQSGDALKRIHWKATAHRDELMVRQEEQQLAPRSAVILDCDPFSQGTARDRRGEWEYSPAFEWCVAAAASVTAHLAAAGHVVALQSNGSFPERVIADGRDSLTSAIADLALVEPQEPDVERPGQDQWDSYVVLGRIRIDRAAHWVASLRGSRQVIAWVEKGTTREALGVLSDAGWRLVPYTPSDDLAELWAERNLGRTRATG